jgi:hypothetical protein
VFYSWQADLPSRANRAFIQDCLEGAAKAVRADESLQVDVRIDRDTADVGGSPVRRARIRTSCLNSDTQSHNWGGTESSW